MTQPFDAKAYLALMAPIVEIKVEPEWQPVVETHLATAAKMAAILDAAPLEPNSLELANYFSPGYGFEDLSSAHLVTSKLITAEKADHDQ